FCPDSFSSLFSEAIAISGGKANGYAGVFRPAEKAGAVRRASASSAPRRARTGDEVIGCLRRRAVPASDQARLGGLLRQLSRWGSSGQDRKSERSGCPTASPPKGLGLMEVLIHRKGRSAQPPRRAESRFAGPVNWPRRMILGSSLPWQGRSSSRSGPSRRNACPRSSATCASFWCPCGRGQSPAAPSPRPLDVLEVLAGDAPTHRQLPEDGLHRNPAPTSASRRNWWVWCACTTQHGTARSSMARRRRARPCP